MRVDRVVVATTTTREEVVAAALEVCAAAVAVCAGWFGRLWVWQDVGLALQAVALRI